MNGISFKKVQKTLKLPGRSSETILSNFSFDFHSGYRYALIGPSGCGKTTLLKIICGITKPDSGTISINLQNPKEIFLKGKVSLFSSDNTLLPWRKTINNILLPIDLIRKRKDKDEEFAKQLLEKMKLVAHEDKYPYEMSDGQLQRVKLAQCLITNPDILLLDEPFNAVDLKLKFFLIEEIKSFLDSSEKLLIIVTHNPEEAFELSDVLLILNRTESEALHVECKINRDSTELSFVKEKIFSLFKIV